MPLVSLRSAVAGLGGGAPAAIHGTETSGPRGIESIIEYNGLYLNVRNWVDTYIVNNILGIDDADVRDTRDVNPGQHGETPGASLYGGRTIVLQGKITTRTIWKMRDMEQALRAAFVDIDQEMPLVFHGTVPEEDLQSWCKKSQKLEIPEAQTTLNHFERTFSITLRASNPRFLSVTRNYTNWVYSGSASFNAIAFNPVNLGNFPAQPYIELTGPMTTPLLSNEINGDVITFTGNIPAGEVWAIDMSTPPRVFRVSDGADRWSFVGPTSTDLLYEPQVQNQIRFTATGLTAASAIASLNYNTLM